MARSTLTSKGQTTVPKEIRDHLALKPGDQIEFVITPDGSVRMDPATLDIRSLRGCLSAFVKKSVSVEAMKAAVRTRFQKK